MADFTVSLLYPSDNYVYSYVSPGCVLYQWHATDKVIVSRLDCSKLVPCSESLNSISIEEHLSPGKCQITALCQLDAHLYVGTSWGCIVVIETDSLRPITIFRPFEEEVNRINRDLLCCIYEAIIILITLHICTTPGTLHSAHYQWSNAAHRYAWPWLPIADTSVHGQQHDDQRRALRCYARRSEHQYPCNHLEG